MGRSAEAGTPAFRIFTVTTDAVVAISGLTPTGGLALLEVINGLESHFGDGILNAGTLSVTAATLRGKSAGFGGDGISLDYGTLTVCTSLIANSNGKFSTY